MRLCPACSKENPDYIKRCLDCGKNIDPSSGKSALKVYSAAALALGGFAAFVVIKKPFSFPPAADTPVVQAIPDSIATPPPLPGSASAATASSLVEVPTEEETHPQATPAESKIVAGPGSTEDVVVESMPAPSESSKAIPKPRKRLQRQTLDTADILTGNSPATFKMRGPGGSARGIQPASEGYMRMLRHVIVKEFIEIMVKQGLNDEPGERFRITLMVNSRSSEIEILKISGTLDHTKQELLRRVIGNCSGRVLCPKELYDDIGEYVKLEFPLSTKS